MHHNLKLFYIIFISLIASFITLIALVIHIPLPQIDIQISQLLQKYHSGFLDKTMLCISIFGELPWSLLLVTLIASIFFMLKYKRESYFILSILFSGLVILGVKNILNRPRPTAEYVRLVEINRFQSFPSGHVMSYVVFFGFMIILMKTIKGINFYVKSVIIYLSVFFIVTIPFSRIYLGAHWFSDIIGGFLLGLIYLMPLAYFYLRRNGDQA